MISVLYVDDDPSLLELGKLFLEQNDRFCVDTVTSARDALALVGKAGYDAIVSDYQMPGMDGIEFLKEVRTQSGIPFILFTGRGREEVVIEAINSGVTFYLQKGGDPTVQFTELAHKIRQAVERARTEAALKEKTEEIDRFLNATVDLFCTMDLDGRFRRLNPAWGRLLSRTPAELAGRQHLDFVHPGDLPAARAAFSRLAAQQPVLDHVNRCRCGDGSYHWIEWQAYPTGNLIYAAARDITERKAAADAARAAEEKFSTIFRQSPDMIWISELESGRFIDVNDAARRILGYAPAELIGKSSTGIGMWSDPGDRALLVQRIRTEGHFDRFETRLRRKNGEVFHASIAASTVALSGTEYLIVTVRDISDIKQAEEALRESELKYRTLIDRANEAILIAQDSALVFANRRGCELLGEEAENLIGRSIADFVWPEDRELVVTRHRQRTAGEPVADTYDFRLMDRAGNPRWVFLSVTLIPWQGRPATLNMMTDISDRKKVEEALTRAEEKYRGLVRNSYDIIYTTDPDGVLTFVSPSATTLLGYSEEELVGTPLLRYVHPDDAGKSAALWQLQSGNGTGREKIVYRIRHADGSFRWHLSKTVPLYGREGEIAGFEGIASDFTEQKAAEDAILAAEEKFSTIYHNSPDIIWISELDSGRFIDVNNAAERIFGYTRGEFIGNTSLGLGIWEDPTDRSELIRQLNAKGRVERFRVRHVRKNREAFDAESSVSTMILGGRKYLIGTVRDISDIQRAEDAVREANRKLSLLSGITRHDIRNQVTIMRGFLAVMGIKHPDPERDAMIRKIDGAAERIASMIQFTKEYEEIGVREPAWQDIGDVVGKASAQVAAGPVAVTNEIPAGREVYADPLIVRVFYNLMDNALRYGGKITEIRFTVEERDGAGVIVCEDDGVGVAPDEKEKIFSREFGKNTGMGLFLAHEILGITGIAIRENGVQGTGARFEIAVPKAMFRATEPPC